jgi:hypothetical protein
MVHFAHGALCTIGIKRGAFVVSRGAGGSSRVSSVVVHGDRGGMKITTVFGFAFLMLPMCASIEKSNKKSVKSALRMAS